MSDDLIAKLRQRELRVAFGSDRLMTESADEITRLRARLDQAERAGFRAGIEAAADWIESAPRGYPHSAYRDSIRALAEQKGKDQ